jgi:hypothetical protein
MVNPRRGMAVKAEDLSGHRVDARFTILDAMALVAASAFGVALSRAYYVEIASVRGSGSVAMEYRTRVYLTAVFVLPFAAALLWCRLRRPCRSTRRLAREPGVGALLAVAVTVVAIAIDQVLMYTLPGPPGTRFIGLIWKPMIGLGSMLATVTGPAVCAVWSLQWLAGLWRPTSDWIDRAGRVLGLTWILFFVLRSWLLLHLWP